MTTVTFRIGEEEKEFLYKMFEELEISPSKFMRDTTQDLMKGDLRYDGEHIKPTKVEPNSEYTPVKTSDVDLKPLYKAAERYKITPQSLLDSALRPYRG